MHKVIDILIIGLLIILIISNFIFYPAEVVGQSMENTFHDGDSVVVCRLLKPKAGDVVIANSSSLKEDLIKRVIAVGTDSIEIGGSKVKVNNKVISEDYIKEPFDSYVSKTVLDKGTYWLMGDNRNHSSDSRMFGTFSSSDLDGVVIIKLSDYGITYYTYNLIRFGIQLILLIILMRREQKGREVLLDV